MNRSPLLSRVLASEPGPFALLHRPDSLGPDRLEVLVGTTCTPKRLADVPLPLDGQDGHQALVLVPHQQVAERGFAATEDDSPLLAMLVQEQDDVALDDALALLPNDPISLSEGHFDISDDEYAEVVRAVLANEIATGQGSNFVIKRSFVATVTDYSISTALTLFRRLVTRETGAYWTFLIHTGDRTFVGATPERHVSVLDNVATMNPISGTYRYPPTGPAFSEVMQFLNDRKETEELYMVLDEELKMMSRICPAGGRVVGPFLRQMARLAHTEYFIEGRTDLDPREILRETLFAPTVTGSPLENACRVIARYEARGRRYYGGVAALISRDANGNRCMDSAILIRTADIRAVDGHAQVEVGVGATLVRHSDPLAEIAETHTKAAGLLAALTEVERLDQHPEVKEALRRRNSSISGFWFGHADQRAQPRPSLVGRRALVVDAEDTFSSMLAQQLRAIGLSVDVIGHDVSLTTTEHDLVVMGPGPGDPRRDDPRMMSLSASIEHLLIHKTPFLAVCLSHQLLCRHLDLELIRRVVPNQGTQREIDLFGRRERVGFYNSYVARTESGQVQHPRAGTVQVSRDADTGEVHAMRGPSFASVQFHLESVLTQNSERILTQLLHPLSEILGSTSGARTT